MVVGSKIPNPPLQISFHYDADLLVISSYFVFYPSYLSIVGKPLVGTLCDPPLLELYISLSRMM